MESSFLLEGPGGLGLAGKSAMRVIFYRTGSNPPAQNGWQRSSRLAPIQTPRAVPYFTTACSMYSEQVGAKRQALGNIGEIQRL